MTRANLTPNPSAKNSGTGWSGTASPARVTGLSGFPRTTGVQSAGSGFIQSPTGVCAPGDVLTVSAHVQGPSVLGTKTIYAAFTRSAGGDDFSQTFTVSLDTSVKRPAATVTAPANATGIYLLFDGVPANTVMAAVMYEPGASSATYEDGDSSGWSWTGVAGDSASAENSGESHVTTGTAIVSMSATATVSTSRGTAGTARVLMSLTAVASGGDESDATGADYDIEQVMTALAATFDGMPTGDVIGGQTITIQCAPDVPAQVEPPTVVLELDGLNYDLNMGGGADSLPVAAIVLVAYQDQEGAQRLLWRFLSRKPTSGLMRLKGALEANQTLGGLVSYAIITGVRNIGTVNYDGVDYLAAELSIEVMS